MREVIMRFLKLEYLFAIAFIFAALILNGCAENELDDLREQSKLLQAKDFNHLSGIPAPSFVLRKIGHSNPPIAIGRQCQALTALHELFDDPLFAPKSLGPLPPEARQKQQAYVKAINELEPKYRQASRNPPFKGGNWKQVCAGSGAVWTMNKLKDSEWIALLQSPARELAERQAKWYTQATPKFNAAQQQAYKERKLKERFTFILTGAFITLIGCYMVVRGWRSMKALDRYEFEHRTSNGVIEFDTHEDAIRHQRKKYIAYNVLYCGGAVTTIIGLIVLFARMFG
jgi:hypothetical protein